jgi:putative transposase
MAETKRMTTDQVVGYLLEGDGLDFLRESLAWVVQELIEAEVSELVGAQRGERAPAERLTHRNGYRPRPWQTRAGELELAIPKLRRGSYFPSFLEPRRRSEQALVSVVQEAYVAGVSTRKVDQVVESLGLRISKSEVSRICQGLDEQVDAFRATGRSKAATRTCGSTPRWRRCVTQAGSCARRSCSPTASTSRATGR